MDLPRIIAYCLDTAVFGVAVWVIWRQRRHPILYRTVALQPWLVASLLWSVFLLVWGLTGRAGNDTLAAINGYIRVLGPACLLACIWDVRRHA